MENLVEALQIFLKYGNPDYPTHCVHDMLVICGIDPDAVSEVDKMKLKGLGFLCGEQFEEERFFSFKFGSA